MDSKGVVFVAIVAYAYCGPLDLKRSTIDRCSQRCEDSNKSPYTTGSTYKFYYEGEQKTGIPGIPEEQAGITINATAEFEVLSMCDSLLTLTDAGIYESDPVNHQNMHQGQNTDTIEALERYPLLFSFKNGIVENVCPNKEDPTWAINVKKGIISTFFNY